MTSRPYELLARFTPHGTIAGVSVKTITTVNGKDFEGDPEPLADATDPAFTAFADAFSAAIVAERDALLIERTAMIETRDALAASVAEQIATLNAARDEALATITTLEADKAALQTQLDEALNPPEPEVDLRVLPPNSFVKRYTTAERIAIRKASITDDQVGLILDELMTAQRVRLDLPVTQQSVAYLASQGLIAPERVAEILADATPEEL